MKPNKMKKPTNGVICRLLLLFNSIFSGERGNI